MPPKVQRRRSIALSMLDKTTAAVGSVAATVNVNPPSEDAAAQVRKHIESEITMLGTWPSQTEVRHLSARSLHKLYLDYARRDGSRPQG